MVKILIGIKIYFCKYNFNQASTKISAYGKKKHADFKLSWTKKMSQSNKFCQIFSWKP